MSITTLLPVVTNVTPVSGKGSDLVTLTITGSHFFGGTTSNSVNAVKLSDGANTSLNIGAATISDTEIRGAVIPLGVTVGTYEVRVTTAGGTNTTSTIQYEVKTPEPLVYSTNPVSGSNLALATLTINGFGFFGGGGTASIVVPDGVKFTSTGTVTATVSTYTVANDSTITGVIVPSGLPVGSYDVRVTNSGGENLTSTQKYLVTTALPTVTMVSPATGSNVVLTTLTIAGSGFFGGLTSDTVTAVKLDNTGTTALTISGAVITDTTITGAVLPPGVPKGTYNIVVTAAGGTNTTSSQKIAITTPPPSVTNVSPSTGSNMGLTTVSISGTGFFGGTGSSGLSAIRLDDIFSTPLNISGASVTDTTITGVVIPSGIRTGSYNVIVGISEGTNTTSTVKFVVTTATPVVSGIVPAFGGDSGFRTVDITGLGFFGGISENTISGLTINGSTVDISQSIISDNNIVGAIIPPGIALGTYNVLVTTSGGSNTTSLEKYSVFPGARVTGVNPATGTTLSPTTLTISGLNYFSGSGSPDIASVNIDNSTATEFILSAASITDTEIKRAVLPAGIAVGTYNIIVTTSLGSNITSSVKLVVLENETIANTVPGSDYTMNIYPVSGRIQIYLEQNTFSEAVKVTLTSKGIVIPAKDRDIIKLSTIGYEVKLNKSIQPQKKVRMTVKYRDSDIAGMDEPKLVIMRYDTDTARWIVLQTTVNQSTNEATAYTDHFSKFVLGQLVPAVDLSNAKVYPNPFNPNRTYLTGGMLFDALTAGATVQIYNIAGEHVWEGTDEDGDGRVLWDGKNHSDKPVAGGIYIALIRGTGGEVKKLKVAVER